MNLTCGFLWSRLLCASAAWGIYPGRLTRWSVLVLRMAPWLAHSSSIPLQSGEEENTNTHFVLGCRFGRQVCTMFHGTRICVSLSALLFLGQGSAHVLAQGSTPPTWCIHRFVFCCLLTHAQAGFGRSSQLKAPPAGCLAEHRCSPLPLDLHLLTLFRCPRSSCQPHCNSTRQLAGSGWKQFFLVALLSCSCSQDVRVVQIRKNHGIGSQYLLFCFQCHWLCGKFCLSSHRDHLEAVVLEPFSCNSGHSVRGFGKGQRNVVSIDHFFGAMCITEFCPSFVCVCASPVVWSTTTRDAS